MLQKIAPDLAAAALRRHVASLDEAEVTLATSTRSQRYRVRRGTPLSDGGTPHGFDVMLDGMVRNHGAITIRRYDENEELIQYSYRLAGARIVPVSAGSLAALARMRGDNVPRSIDAPAI
jgi:hypothetical protein